VGRSSKLRLCLAVAVGATPDAMYPRINTTAPGVLHIPPPGTYLLSRQSGFPLSGSCLGRKAYVCLCAGQANAYYPTVGVQSCGEPSHQTAFANGPVPASGGSPTSQNFPLLRVHIADQYRTLPPVSNVHQGCAGIIAQAKALIPRSHSAVLNTVCLICAAGYGEPRSREHSACTIQLQL
jgi:hypothetical protein